MKDFYNKYNGIIKLVLSFIIFYFSSYLIVIPLRLLGVKLVPDTQTYYYVTFAVNVFRALLIFLLFFKDIKKDFKPFKEHFWEYSDITVKYWLLGLFIMATSNILISILTPSKMASNEADVRTMIAAIPIFTLIMTTITAPVSEELIFRKSFKNVINNKVLYILISGFFFGALHVLTADISSPIDFLYIIPYSSLGLAFAAICYKTDNILPSMMMHSIHNGAITLVTILVQTGILL